MKADNLYTRSVALAGLPEFIEQLGGAPEDLFERAGLNIAHVSSTDHFVSWSNICTLLELAAAELNEPSLGIKWAHHVPKDFLNSGPMLFLATTVKTMHEFIDLAFDYQKIHTNGVSYHYEIDKEAGLIDGYIRVHPATPPCRQYIEHIVAACVILEEHYSNTAVYHKIYFQHGEPADLSWHKKTFKCPVEFNAKASGGVMESSFLDYKIGGQLKILQPLLKFHLARQIKKNPTYHQSIKQMVEELLPTIMGVGNSSFDRMAYVMEMNPKKLQRLLKQEGTSYSQILDTVRQSMTRRFLAESDASISRIASLLDYASSEAFNAACQRWTGMSPRAYRKHLRGISESDL